MTGRTRMSKAEAGRIARRARAYGYFALDDYQCRAYVLCPLCRAKVHAERYQNHHSDAGLKRLLLKALDAAMVTHLTSEYDDERCPRAAGGEVG
ncbi:MAG: hypothetical protein IRZ08_20795 [Frankia sp.]|nr:hypothetical protein [Frankia sp.]